MSGVYSGPAIAVIGAGIMGSAMTRTLVAAVAAGYGREDVSVARLALDKAKG